MFEGFSVIKPAEIEEERFATITRLLGEQTFPPLEAPIVKRVIHTTADFEFAHALHFTQDVVKQAAAAIREGCHIVTDTKMAAAGINKRELGKYGGEVVCLIGDASVAKEAKERQITRSAVCMERLAPDAKNGIFALGNAPTALIRLSELIEEGKAHPRCVIGVPVGFVNVVDSKECILQTNTPSIVAKGRKGGSTVAAAIVNAILYMMRDGRA
ncbi:MAG TPA: precorrin-8X methylmutase [Ruminococcaceae bacterium]|nr:precorrin-8X methylmutase [Oscillospiraceae bacterium]